jgi:predicted dehydrogenase
MHDIGVAVIGAGFMGPVHTEALRRAGVKVVGVLGIDEAESKKAATTLGLEKAYRTLDEVLADETAQAVHLAVPNKLHYEMARRALEAGKHVLCEKPLAMSSSESAGLMALAARHPKQAAGVNYNVRFYPICLEARRMVRGGELGQVYHVCGSYVQDWLFLDTDYNWRVLPEEGGELRSVADIGTHWFDLVGTITGLQVEAVCADLMTVHPVRKRPKGEVETFKGKEEAHLETEPVDIATDDYGCVMLRFVGGAKGVLWTSQVTAGRKNCLRFELAGSKAALEWVSERPNELWIGRREKANETLLRDPSLVGDAARAAIAYPGGHNEGFPDTFKQGFKAFYDYIAAGDFDAPPPFATFADGHRELLLCEAVLRSSTEGGWVRVEGGTR